MGQYGGSPLDWNTSPASRFAPSPEEARGEEGQLHLRIPPQRVRNTGTYTRHTARRARGPNMMGTAGRQFGAPARSLPTQTARRPLMRHRVHVTSTPTSEPQPKRASGNTRARSSPHRQTRKISRGREGERDFGGTFWQGVPTPTRTPTTGPLPSGLPSSLKDSAESPHVDANTAI